MKYFDTRTLFLLYKHSLPYYPKIRDDLNKKSSMYLSYICKTTPTISQNIISFIEPQYLIYLFKGNTIQFYQSILFNDIKRLNNVFKKTVDHELTNKKIQSYYVMKQASIDLYQEAPANFNISEAIHLYERIGYLLREYIRDLSWKNRRKEASRYEELFEVLKDNFYLYYLWIDHKDMYNLTSTLIKINYQLKHKSIICKV